MPRKVIIGYNDYPLERVPVLLSLRALEAPSEQLLVRRVAGLRFLRRFVLLHAGEESLPTAPRALFRFLREAAHLNP